MKPKIVYYPSGEIASVHLGKERLRRSPNNKSCRAVFIGKRYVVKTIDYVTTENDFIKSEDNPHPIKQNEKEYRVWKRASKTKDRQFFAPVVSFGDGFKWIVAKKVTPTVKGWSKEHEKAYDDIVSKLERKYRFSDAMHQFFLAKKKKPVIYDYGFRGQM